jgi:Uma2 family endonuclease
MRTVVLGTRPEELEALIARRHTLGLDDHDEVWEGEYHMAPMAHWSHGRLDDVLARLLGPLADRARLVGTGAFNLGEPSNFRVPDRGFHRPPLVGGAFLPTAAVVVEIVSPDDETWDKLPFYAAHGVDELLIVDARLHSVVWMSRSPAGDGYRQVDASELLGVTADDLATRIDWPAVDET